MTMIRLFQAVVLAVCTTFTVHVHASEAVRIIVPFAQGDASDLVARIVAQPLAKELDRPVVVGNHYGAGGIVGTQDAVRSKTDGLTLVLGSFSNMSANTVCRGERLGYLPSSALRPVAMLARAPIIVGVSSGSSIQAFPDLVAALDSDPGIRMYSSPGLCSYGEFVARYIAKHTNVDVVSVAYRGGLDATQAVVNGDVDVVITELPSAQHEVQAGRLKMLAASAGAQTSNVPAFAGLGLKQFDALVWYGFFVPAETPSREGRLIQAAVQKVMGDPSVVQQLHAIGAEPYQLSGAEIYREVVNLTRNIKASVTEAGLTLE